MALLYGLKKLLRGGPPLDDFGLPTGGGGVDLVPTLGDNENLLYQLQATACDHFLFRRVCRDHCRGLSCLLLTSI
jgi:hypothetical protein